jgi:hypothetical protein
MRRGLPWYRGVAWATSSIRDEGSAFAFPCPSLLQKCISARCLQARG